MRRESLYKKMIKRRDDKLFYKLEVKIYKRKSFRARFLNNRVNSRSKMLFKIIDNSTKKGKRRIAKLVRREIA